jgi:hypothetical protein
VILDFIMSLLTKVATAPFKLLGALFGGGEEVELGHVDFLAGSSMVPEDEKESLVKLAEALGKRPQLSIEIRGRSDAQGDATALKHEKFATMAGEKAASDPKKYGGELGYSMRLLETLCVERLGKPGLASLTDRHRVAAGELPEDHPRYKSGSKKIVVDERALALAIQDTLTVLQPVDEADLLSLANARGNAIKLDLMGRGIEEARVFVLDPEPGQVEDGRIRIDLALTD